MKSRYRHGTILWKPDESVPYMIHSKGHYLDNMVIIWPEVIQITATAKDNAAEEYFFYMTNREHVFTGTLKHRPIFKRYSTNTEVDFYQHDGSGRSALLHIAPLTDKEFLSIQENYKKQYNISICSREELMQNFVKRLDD